MSQLPKVIERYYLSEYDRNAVFVPSGRFGIYAIVKSVFSPGDKIIVSPLTCPTAVLALFAGGVIPVFVDVDIETGNIDVEKLSRNLLGRVKGVMTTNLYGTPDRTNELASLCEKSGLFLLEDCAHIVDARIGGRRVGSIGNAAAFSFYKFLNTYGGVVLSKNRKLLQNVRAIVDSEGMKTTRLEALSDRLKWGLVHGVPGGGKIKEHIKTSRSRLRSAFGSGVREPVKQPLSYAGVGPLDAASLKPLHGHFAYSGKPYDKCPSASVLKRTSQVFGSIDELIDLKRMMNDRLIEECPLQLKRAPYETDYCNFLVPYFSDYRDKIVERLLIEKRIKVWYVYNPPLSDVFDGNSFVNMQQSPEIAREWGRRVLPVDSTYRKEYLEIIQKTDSKSSRVDLKAESPQVAENINMLHH